MFWNGILQVRVLIFHLGKLLKASNRPKLTQTLGPTSPIVTESELQPDLNSKETVKEAQKDSNAWLAPSSNPITHDEWEKKVGCVG
ncbi:hypothetical protein BCR33DRAFT_721147 [Rhizoclosmatium globosum]|uniref:Uncharacterized protein n=1 Tax=Rhizoclosmatium globosum TaxID=329046 RepID=A0A1Y2BT88_9FUNG|nr:hypothetical protein BCR33DRAFT_721147 [Rhizoclosmatium globosum]|eukprot:ORY37953.1 hypothetical protein BCR33DRAFT_721147 [Rhizoclosmatium globosum]